MTITNGKFPSLAKEGQGWFGQFPKPFCEEVDRTTPNPSFAKEGNLTRTFNYTHCSVIYQVRPTRYDPHLRGKGKYGVSPTLIKRGGTVRL